MNADSVAKYDYFYRIDFCRSCEESPETFTEWIKAENMMDAMEQIMGKFDTGYTDIIRVDIRTKFEEYEED